MCTLNALGTNEVEMSHLSLAKKGPSFATTPLPLSECNMCKQVPQNMIISFDQVVAIFSKIVCGH